MDAKIRAKQTWKEALHESCHRSTQPFKAIADGLGVHRSTLDKACDEHQVDNLSSKHLPALASLTDNLAWLDFLEARAGRVAHPIPKAGTLCSVQTIAALREFAEFASAVTEGAADGDLSDADIERIDREGVEAMAAISSVIARAKQQRDERAQRERS